MKQVWQMTGQEICQSDACKEGRRARQRFQPQAKNPYAITQIKKHTLWRIGWGDCDIEKRAQHWPLAA